MKPPGYRLGLKAQILVYGVFALLFLSGAAWWWVHTNCQTPGSFQPAAPHWSETWWLKGHGMMAMASLVIIGALLPSHVRLAWKAGLNRISGGIFLTVTGLLALSGYGLYYAGGECLRSWVQLFHRWGGLVFPFIMAVHVISGRRVAKKVRATKRHSA